MNKSRATSLDVLVIGAGPAGTALAIDLVRRGLNVRIVDKAAGAFNGSRAKGLQPRTLEVLDDFGVLDDVLEGGSRYPRLAIHLGPFAVPWRMLVQREPSSDVPFPNTWLIPQSRTDRALHARLEALGGRVQFGTTLTELSQDASLATATLHGTHDTEQVTARYVVGADGAASSVRTLLGIGFVGSTDELDRIVIADAVVTGLSRDRWHIWPGLKGRFVAACPLPHTDMFQWMIRLAPGEEPMRDREGLSARIRAHTRDVGIDLGDVRWTSVFRPNIRLAERYRNGRVFLVGDAAHVHTPAGAQGLNTGIQDAYNLGWKIGQVLAGADEQLLSSYEAERLPIAAAVLGLSTKKYQAITKLSTSSIRRGKDEQQLGLSYYGGPLAAPQAERTKTLRAGDRAPDAELCGAGKDRSRLFDAYRGPHFTAVAYGVRAAQHLDRSTWPSRGAALKRVVIDADSERTDLVYRDNAHTFRRAYGVTDDALVFIRPDGYIGHIAIRDLSMATYALRAMTPMSEGMDEGSTKTARR